MEELKEGAEVIYTGTLKGLNKGEVGVISSIKSGFCFIIYPQNSAYKYNDDGTWEPIKGAPNKIYAHSAKLNEVNEKLP